MAPTSNLMQKLKRSCHLIYIEDVEKTNVARVAIGLPALKKGEYRIVEGK